MSDGGSNTELHATSGVARFAWAVLAYNLAVILWGAYVRAIGIGRGLRQPLAAVQRRRHSAVAIGGDARRVLASADERPRAAQRRGAGRLDVGARRSPAIRHALGAAASVFFMLTEAALGAGLVLFRLVADNATMARALFMAAHLLNTFILLKALTLTAWWLSGGPRTSLSIRVRRTAAVCIVLGPRRAADRRQRRGRRARRHAVPIGLAGRGPARRPDVHVPLPDPPARVASGNRRHRRRAAAAGRTRVCPKPADEPGLRIGRALVLAVGAQLLAGLANILLLAPIWMQMVHLLLADLVWIAFVLLSARCLRVDAR